MYMSKANDVSGSEAVLSALKSGAASTELYGDFYDFVNRSATKANFFVFDSQLHPVIASSTRIPEYARSRDALGWGVLRRMMDSPNQVVLARQSSNATFRSTLTIGKAIVLNGSVVGFAAFDLEEKDLIKMFSQNFSTSTVITDSFGYVIAYTNELLVDRFGKIDAEFRDESGVVKSMNDSHYVARKTILGGELSVYTITSIGFFNSIRMLVGVLLVLLCAMLTLTTYLSARKIASSKTRVIDDMIRAVENVKNGNLQTRLEVNTNNEFQVFAESYNQMLSDIEHLIEVNKEKALQTVLAEIKQLESQFNPHFLFNTLEMIRYMVKIAPASVNQIIVGLSELLRYSINNNITEISLREDIEYTQNYLLIQKYRFGKNLNYSIDVDEAAYDCIVPKLLVQPMIENAIKYGFAAKSALMIRIQAGFVENKLVVVISDDGGGMGPEVLAELKMILAKGINHSIHMGLYNVHRRVRLMYGEAYGVEISSEENRGTVVKIKLPSDRGDGLC
ncbi:sensor histidine kinase [Cohnella cellulosilytica]